MPSLKVNIGANTRGFSKGMGKLKHSISSVAGSFGAMLGVGAAGYALVGFGKKIIDLGDELGKMSKRFGVGVEWLQKLKHMAELSGVGLGSVDKALKSQSRALRYASQGLKTYLRPFDDLNLSHKELINMKPEEAFEKIAAALGKERNEIQRAAMAQEIFGRSGKEMLPMIREWNALLKEGEGAVIFSEDDIKSAEAFKDSMTELNKTLMSIAIDSGFLQWIADVADRLKETINLLNRPKKGGETGTGMGSVLRDMWTAIPGNVLGRAIVGESGLNMNVVTGEQEAFERKTRAKMTEALQKAQITQNAAIDNELMKVFQSIDNHVASQDKKMVILGGVGQ